MAFPNAPTPLSYGPPQVQFDGLDQLGDKYFQGAEQRRKYDLARAFQGGIPKDAQGNPDFRAMAEVLAQHGAPEQVIPFSQQAVAEQERAALQGAVAPGGATSGPSVTAPSTSPPSGPLPPTGIPRTATPSTPRPQEGESIRTLATGLAGGKEVSPIISQFVRQNRISPDAPLTPEQEAQFKPILAKAIAEMQPLGMQGSGQERPTALVPPGVDPRTEIAKLRATADRISATAGPRGAALAQQYNDRADRLESDAFGTQAELRRQHDIAERKPVPVTPGTQLVNPLTGVPVFGSETGLLDKATIDAMARQAMSGDTSVFTNLGRGAQGAENVIAVRKRIAELNSGSGETGAEQAQRNAEFFGVKAGQRTLGIRSANIELAATEFKQVLPVVQAASKSVSRTNYPDLNKIIQMFEEKTGDPNVVKFGGGVNTLVNLYARAISPSGNPTVSDKDHARLILNRAWSQGQFDAAAGMMSQEIDAALSSPEAVRDAMRKRFLEGQGGAKPSGNAPAAAPSATPSQAQAPVGAKPQTVIQNGHTYTLQPDGSYK